MYLLLSVLGFLLTERLRQHLRPNLQIYQLSTNSLVHTKLIKKLIIPERLLVRDIFEPIFID
jgi:hypothetical protein